MSDSEKKSNLKIERDEMIFHLIECGHTFAEVSQIFNIPCKIIVKIYNETFRKHFGEYIADINK